jgi:SulP family sulfate permease
MRKPFCGLGRPKSRDVLAGLVTGLFSIPEGMAYASIGGFNPVVGLYSGIVPGIVASLFARTVLMVTTLTSAIALSSRSVLGEVGFDPGDPANVAALAIVVGAVMALFGLLRFGSIMNFVSNAVMTGFSTGIAVQIIAGVLGDATGYKPESGNTIGKFIDSLAHIGAWHPAAVAVAAGTVAVWAVFHFIKPLESFAILLALVVVTAVVSIAQIEVETVGDIAAIANSLPPLVLPNFAAMPELIVGGVAVALVALAQAAGISAAVPNPDGSRPNMSRDFFAQGAGNLAGRFFGALPTGGSLSRTGVATSAGAQTRWAGVFAGLWLAALVLVARFGGRDHPDAGHRWADHCHRHRTGHGPSARHPAGAARRAAVRGRHADHLRGHHAAAPAHRDSHRRHHVAGALLRQGGTVRPAGRAGTGRRR